MAIPIGPRDARLRYCDADDMLTSPAVCQYLSALTAQTSTPAIATVRLCEDQSQF